MLVRTQGADLLRHLCGVGAAGVLDQSPYVKDQIVRMRRGDVAENMCIGTPFRTPEWDEYRARKTDEPQEQDPAICRTFLSALGRTRTCDLLIRSLN